MTLGQKPTSQSVTCHTPFDHIYAHGRATGALLLPRASAAARPGALECAFSAPRAQGGVVGTPQTAQTRAPLRACGAGARCEENRFRAWFFRLEVSYRRQERRIEGKETIGRNKRLKGNLFLIDAAQRRSAELYVPSLSAIVSSEDEGFEASVGGAMSVIM